VAIIGGLVILILDIYKDKENEPFRGEKK